MIENKQNEHKPKENKVKEHKPNEHKPKENKVKEHKPNEHKSKENKVKEHKPNEHKPNENKVKEHKLKKHKSKEHNSHENGSKTTKKSKKNFVKKNSDDNTNESGRKFGSKKSGFKRHFSRDERPKKEFKYNQEDVLVGKFIAHERGFGFVAIEDREQDVFVPSDLVKGAFQGDTVGVVVVKEAKNGKREEGRVVEIIERGVVHLVGYYEKCEKFGFVRPDNQKFGKDIFVPFERSKGAVNGHKVMVELLSYGDGKKKPSGKVVKIIGHCDEPGVDIMSIVMDADIPVEFPEKVLDQAQRVGVPVSPADREGRKDIRSWQTVTIDGEDAKDLDDAITLTKEGKYYHLGVHIADVTNYVQENSALDKEALKRGTSVYLVDRVIPMLPKVLSNGVCSLNAGEDRLALSCIMKIGMDGQVVDQEITETVIHVDERMTYTAVKNILISDFVLASRMGDNENQGTGGMKSTISINGDKIVVRKKKSFLERLFRVKSNPELVGYKGEISGINPPSNEELNQNQLEGEKLKDAVTSENEVAHYADFIEMFKNMEDLAAILRKKRFARGSIDFDFPETKMILDENGTPIEIKAYDRNVATKIIEEFMLLANETVSEYYTKLEMPFVYRTHEVPDIERIQSLRTFVEKFGHTMYVADDKVKPLELQALLNKIEGTPECDLISRLMLRSMKQAKYSPNNDGHFGLAAEYYSHFTSPIRRYPDLQIHRIIKDDLRKRLGGQKQDHYKTILPKVTQQCSELERRAESAERETIKLKKVEYMEKHVGEKFQGIIGSLTRWGMYIELSNTIEGLVHVTSMTDDHYEYFEEQMEMVGERTGKVYKLGQEVTVEVVNTDKLSRTIDFKLAE